MSSEAITRNDLKAILDGTLQSYGIDYIVEQGTSGNWTYRKWQSGLAEAWWENSYTVSANTVDINKYVQYPFTIYGIDANSAPVISCGLKAGGADLYRFHLEGGATNTTQARLVLINKHTSAVGMIPQMYIKGYWKLP